MNDDMPVNETINSAAAESVAESENETVEPMVSAGTQLAALREARGWTTVQIASQLNLANRQIQALEADNYAALPGMVIVRGFIRSYAKVLQIDPAPILAAVIDDAVTPPVLPPERNTLSTSFSEAKLSPSGSYGLLSKVVMGLVAIVVIGVLLFVGQRMGWLPEGVTSLSLKTEEKLIPIESAEAVMEVPQTQAEVTEPTTAANESAQPVSPVAAQPPLVRPVPVLVPVSAPTPVAALQENQAEMPVAAVPRDSKDALAIKVREDSWVEIKRADNSIVLSRLLKAGSAEVVEVSGPVSMVIGNAAGVDVTLRGAPIDVVAGNASNVARLNLK